MQTKWRNSRTGAACVPGLEEEKETKTRVGLQTVIKVEEKLVK